MEQRNVELNEIQGEGPAGPSIGDLMGIVRRRKWEIVLPAAAIFGLAVLAAVVLPRTYKAMTTILIEEQEVPREYVAANITSFAVFPSPSSPM